MRAGEQNYRRAGSAALYPWRELIADLRGDQHVLRGRRRQTGQTSRPGCFLCKIPGYPGTGCCEFSKYRIYLAAPLFSEAERSYNTAIAELLRAHYYEVSLPQDAGDDHAVRDKKEHMRIYNRNRRAIRDADILVAIIDGADADSGTAWEMGYALGLKKTVIALRTDFRMAGSHERVNLMLEQSAQVVKDQNELLAALGAPSVSAPHPEQKSA